MEEQDFLQRMKKVVNVGEKTIIYLSMLIVGGTVGYIAFKTAGNLANLAAN